MHTFIRALVHKYCMRNSLRKRLDRISKFLQSLSCANVHTITGSLLHRSRCARIHTIIRVCMRLFTTTSYIGSYENYLYREPKGWGRQDHPCYSSSSSSITCWDEHCYS